MKLAELQELANEIVNKSKELLILKQIGGEIERFDYLAVFPEDESKRTEILDLLEKLGSKIVYSTENGNVYKLPHDSNLNTDAGKVGLIKVYKAKFKSPMKGYVDYKLRDYETFKDKYGQQEGFRIEERTEWSMIEVYDPRIDVYIYLPSTVLTEDPELRF